MMPKPIHQAYHCLLFCLLLFCFLVVSYDAAAQGSVTLSGQVKDWLFWMDAPLPPQVLTVLASHGIFLPSLFTYLNLGPLRNDGIELPWIIS